MRIAVVDVETTGLNPNAYDRICEIGIVVIDSNGDMVLEYETLINPMRDLGRQELHGIMAEDANRAPTFEAIAGDVLGILRNCTALAGHNVSFDYRFLHAEFARLGVTLPEWKILDTLRMFGRRRLAECCQAVGLEVPATDLHTAIVDARLTSQLVKLGLQEDDDLRRELADASQIVPIDNPLETPCFTRRVAASAREREPSYISRLAASIVHDVEAAAPNVLAYSALIDRVLEDRVIDTDEGELIVKAAVELELSLKQVQEVHVSYLNQLATAALADGVVTDLEREDLTRVARLLGQPSTELNKMLDVALQQLQSLSQAKYDKELSGTLFYFTGTPRTQMSGRAIDKTFIAIAAQKAGARMAERVTKSIDICVLADPDSNSGSARKARQYGLRMLPEVSFVRMIGIVGD